MKAFWILSREAETAAKLISENTTPDPLVRECLDKIEDVLLEYIYKHTSGSTMSVSTLAINVLSALRGPDDEAKAYEKDCKTNWIRVAAFPRLVTQNMPQLPWYITLGELKPDKGYPGGDHYNDHIKLAYKALGFKFDPDGKLIGRVEADRDQR